MPEANLLVMRRAILLWVGAGLLLGLNIFAAYQQSLTIIYSALALTGAFAFIGVGFGAWAARKISPR